MTSPLSIQGILATSTLLFSTVIKLLVPKPAINPLATLKILSGPNIVPPLTLVKETVSILLPLFSPSMTSLFLAQRIPAPFTLLSGIVVKPSILPATQFISLTPLLDLAVESPA